MERFPGQRQQDDELMDQDREDTEQPWVLGRDLSPGPGPDTERPVADDEATEGRSRMMLAAVAAILSGVALLSVGMMLLSDQLASSAWPLLLAVVAVVAAAVALFGWWRQGSTDSAAPRT